MDGVSFPFIYARCDKDLEMKLLNKGRKEIELSKPSYLLRRLSGIFYLIHRIHFR